MSLEPDEIATRAEDAADVAKKSAESAQRSADSALLWGIVAIVGAYVTYRCVQDLREMIKELPDVPH